MEAHALAVLAVPGLELRGRLGILHDLVDAATEGLHRLEVAPLELGRLLVGLRVLLGVHPHDVGPAVGHQILLGLYAGHRMREVDDALLLPARLEALEPLDVGRAVPPHTNRARRALEDVQLLRSLGEAGDGLHRRGARADDADALVGKVHHRLA